MKSPSRNCFSCPKWLQCACCLLPLSFLGCLSIGAAFGVAISPYVAVPLVLLNAKVIAAAFGSDLAPLITFGNVPVSKLFASIDDARAKKRDEAA
jgi:hypothetical protein